MSSYPNRYESNIGTSSTANRGVEAKECEIVNTRLDASASRTASPECDASDACLQVVVERQRRPPPPPARHHHDTCMECGAGDAPATLPSPDQQRLVEEASSVEVYRFEPVGSALAVSGGGAPALTRVERAATACVSGARRAAGEAGAALRLVAGAPLHAALLAVRGALRLMRDAAAGLVHAASDYGLKPALALAHNAVVQPLLVFVGQVLAGAHEATRPVLAALDEVAGSLARLLAAFRPFHASGVTPERY